jgi:NADP-dependent 3-hydroxy acid dehydrogenase YdfG
MGVPVWLQIGDGSSLPLSMRRADPIWLIADNSSPVGLSVAKEVVQRGHRVILAARNTAAMQDLTRGFPNTTVVVALPGTTPDDIARMVQEAKDRFGPIEVLVNTPGVGSLPSLG